MRRALSILLLVLLGGAPAAAQIPAEWQSAAQAVIGELERDTPQAAKPWTGAELTQGWSLARAWRKHNNGNIEIILAEYLMFVALCRRGCANSTIEGQGYVGVAEQAKALRNQNGGAYAMTSNAHAWLAGLPDPSGAAQKNAALWAKDLDVAAADFATSNIYALAWLLARNRPTPAEQADAFARFAIFVQGKAWLGARCIDISRVATVLDAPPRVETCK
ncbi:MAG: hypothetical protein Q8K93_20045 [Reyranella sp.]|uniref:hypothetical protein n=1 Tax=Reyranella sp. TaxID=1929291 RepID=UPI00272FF661|nr:hypothetical protein [Reyranella sp.]MDP1964477.1 hypothetical protein [Reyranella sp.]MDP2372007.1 hypothetical protein [Reyranella sp.]